MRGRRGASREEGGPGVCWWRHDKRHARGPTQGWGPRARAERTSNMPYMFLTLEVSKLSGWLKAHVACRIEGRACDAGKERCGEAGGPVVCAGGTQEACTGMGRLKAWGPRARAERTLNM
jgi:hypothetical protein